MKRHSIFKNSKRRASSIETPPWALEAGTELRQGKWQLSSFAFGGSVPKVSWDLTTPQPRAAMVTRRIQAYFLSLRKGGWVRKVTSIERISGRTGLVLLRGWSGTRQRPNWGAKPRECLPLGICRPP